jgi:6,7-dimethyl-8-ribityllumazine synthase
MIDGQRINPFPIALVCSHFNKPITQALYDGATARLAALDFSQEHITDVWVPGVVEIPLVAQRLAQSGRFKAVVCLGAVIRGETSHYDYVCQQVSDGCQRVALDFNLPIIFGVLTTETEAQARDRIGGAHGHKGVDAIDAAVHMVSVLQQLEDMSPPVK